MRETRLKSTSPTESLNYLNTLFLKLNCSNDPLVGNLEVLGAINVAETSTAYGLKLHRGSYFYSDSSGLHEVTTSADIIGVSPAGGAGYNPVQIRSGNDGYGIFLDTANHVGILTKVPSSTLDVNGIITGINYISSVATGISPYACTSETLCTHLNCDLLDSAHVGTSGATIPLLSTANTWTLAQTFSTSPITSTLTAGRVVYVGASKELVDSSTFLFDGTNLTLPTGGDIRPSANSTTAINIAQADGTDFVSFDTTNKSIAIGGGIADPRQLFIHKANAANAFNGIRIYEDNLGANLMVGTLMGPTSAYYGVGFWTSTVPTFANAIVLSDGTNTYFNALTGGIIDFQINNAAKMRMSAAGGLSLGSTYFATDAGAKNMIIEGILGIGITAPTSKLHLVDTYSTAGTTYSSLFLNFTSNSGNSAGITHEGVRYQLTSSGSTAFSGGLYGMYNYVLCNQTATTANVRGNYNIVQWNNASGGNLTNGYGMYNEFAASNVAASNLVGSAYGSYNRVFTANAKGRVASAYGGYYQIDSITSGRIDAGYALYVGTPTVSGTLTTYYGLYINTPAGTTAYAAVMLGNVGIGAALTAPTAWLHLAAGTATASTAPLKFTQPAALLATPEALAVEPSVAGDDLNFTIVTGAARKSFVLTDGTNLTATRVPFATTNGRLTDDADLTFATDTLTATKIVGTTSVKVGTAAGFISSDGSTGATGTFTTVDLKTVTVKDGIITSIV